MNETDVQKDCAWCGEDHGKIGGHFTSQNRFCPRWMSLSELRRRLRFTAKRLHQFEATWNPKFIDWRFGVGDTINQFAPTHNDEMDPTELGSAFMSLAEEMES